jgi:hypothetical protein
MYTLVIRSDSLLEMKRCRWEWARDLGGEWRNETEPSIDESGAEWRMSGVGGVGAEPSVEGDLGWAPVDGRFYPLTVSERHPGRGAGAAATLMVGERHPGRGSGATADMEGDLGWWRNEIVDGGDESASTIRESGAEWSEWGWGRTMHHNMWTPTLYS